ncbi:MAG: hypothetical protein AB7G93_23165 [Bdellovibrionales bacterium]
MNPALLERVAAANFRAQEENTVGPWQFMLQIGSTRNSALDVDEIRIEELSSTAGADEKWLSTGRCVRVPTDVIGAELLSAESAIQIVAPDTYYIRLPNSTSKVTFDIQGTKSSSIFDQIKTKAGKIVCGDQVISDDLVLNSQSRGIKPFPRNATDLLLNLTLEDVMHQTAEEAIQKCESSSVNCAFETGQQIPYPIWP